MSQIQISAPPKKVSTLGVKKEYLEVHPISSLSGRIQTPASKPETQRAIIAAALSPKRTLIRNALNCSEVAMMRGAWEQLGVVFREYDDYLEVNGIDLKKAQTKNLIIQSAGSGLVFRLFTAFTCFIGQPSMITGDAILCSRVNADLLKGLETLGADIESLCEPGKAPVVNWGRPLRGGRVVLPGNISSQFITAILFAAPFADEPTQIVVENELLSQSYIAQTITTMRMAGIKVDVDDEYRNYTVYPGKYWMPDVAIKEDYTSISYLLAAAAILPGSITFDRIYGESQQGEAYFLEILRQMGVEPRFDSQKNQLTLINHNPGLKGDFSFDVSNCPNIVPTLAALGSYVQGRFRITGAAITRFHKAPRVQAMVTELRKLGVEIEPILKEGYFDGFEIHGKSKYEGGVTFESWKDHRIFMSLFVASLRAERPCLLEGSSGVICSFPEFLASFETLGVETHYETPNQEIES